MIQQSNGEIWVLIPGFPHYEVSSLGGFLSKTTGRMIVPYRSQTGYSRVNLSREGKFHNLLAHRLVAQAFLVPTSDNQHQVDHLNGNRMDIRVENLRWATPSENMINAGTRKRRRIITKVEKNNSIPLEPTFELLLMNTNKRIMSQIDQICEKLDGIEEQMVWLIKPDQRFHVGQRVEWSKRGRKMGYPRRKIAQRGTVKEINGFSILVRLDGLKQEIKFHHAFFNPLFGPKLF